MSLTSDHSLQVLELAVCRWGPDANRPFGHFEVSQHAFRGSTLGGPLPLLLFLIDQDLKSASSNPKI